MITIEGKEYPLWSQFVEKKEEWIGGFGEAQTEIIDIKLEKVKE